MIFFSLLFLSIGMLLLAAWSTNGWLPSGHAMRMALDLGLHRALEKLAEDTGKQRTEAEERDLGTSFSSCFFSSPRSFRLIVVFVSSFPFSTTSSLDSGIGTNLALSVLVRSSVSI
jgi:hypothetical protein